MRRRVHIVAAHTHGGHFVEQYRAPPVSIPAVYALKKPRRTSPKGVQNVVIDVLNSACRKRFPARRRKQHARRVRSPEKSRHLRRSFGRREPHAEGVVSLPSRTPRCEPGSFRNSHRPCLTSRYAPTARPSRRRFPVFPETRFRKADREVRHSDKR